MAQIGQLNMLSCKINVQKAIFFLFIGNGYPPPSHITIAHTMIYKLDVSLEMKLRAMKLGQNSTESGRDSARVYPFFAVIRKKGMSIRTDFLSIST